MPLLPAICDRCGTVFSSGFLMEGGSATMIGCKAGPCPSCGADGTIPDGFYDFIGKTLRIVSNWSPERRQQFASQLASARKAKDARSAVEATIDNEPELRALAMTLLIPRDSGQFWAFIAALLTMLALLTGEPSVTERTVIERVITQPAPAKPQSKKPPPSPSRVKPKRSSGKAKGRRGR